MVTNEFLSTSKRDRVERVVGLGAHDVVLRGDVHADVQPLVDLGRHAGRDDDRRVELVDDRRALERARRPAASSRS